MAKIIIDTNVFLDFYRSNNESLKKLEDLKKYAGNLLFPEQVFNEYNRNRNAQFEFMRQEFSKYKKSLNPFNSNYIKSFEEYEELIDLNNQTKKQIDKLLNKIEEVKNETENDEIYKVVTDLYRMKEVQKLYINEDIILRSKRRQVLGNPPGTNDITIGDEVIWESVLSQADEDIVIVSNDLSFINNKRFLDDEFQQRRGLRLLDITNKITDAIKIIGVTPSEKLKELEDETEQIILRAKSSLEAEATVINQRNYARGHYCPVCGSNGPWNGVMCLKCGAMDDD